MKMMLLEKLKLFDVVLASGSPRRKQLLTEMDIPFRVITKPVEEVFPAGLSPEETAVFLARLKSDAFTESDLHGNTLLITADTVVALHGRILGKPVDADDAVGMLEQLCENHHDVVTGVCLRLRQKQTVFTATTRVWFHRLSREEIRYYVDHYKPFDKAGAYGIQEWIGHAAIQKIEGSYFNVMGLPTHMLYRELLSFVEKDE